MKKIIVATIVSASLALATSAFALKSMDSDSMKDATAQAGVSLTVDDVVLESWSGTTTYWDNDGASDISDAVADTRTGLVIGGSHTVKTFQAMTSRDTTTGLLVSPGIGLTHDTIDAVALAGLEYGVYQAHALDIDIGTLAILSAGKTYNAATLLGYTSDVVVAGVIIGLPTLEINTTELTGKVISIDQAGAVNDGTVGGHVLANNGRNAQFIEIQTTSKTLHILGGTLEIAPH